MKHILVFLLILIAFCSFGQMGRKVFTNDITNFWIAYDSVHSTNNIEKQKGFIKSLYIDKASEGLKAFIKNKENLEEKWLNLITKDKVFWDKVRPKTLSITQRLNKLENSITQFQTIYSNLKNASTYFIIGLCQQGGTIRNNISIIGSEVIVSEPTYNLNQLKRICIHEYVHTQQSKPDFSNITVLTSSIREGACDFISELVIKHKLNLPYIEYGEKNEVSVWKTFNQDMLTTSNDFWVSTGSNPILPVSDLGYYVGYAICKTFYKSQKDKSLAIKEIIELDYANQNAVNDFLRKSNYENYIIKKGFNPSEKLRIEGYLTTSKEVVFEFYPQMKNVVIDEEGTSKTYTEKDFGKIKTIKVVGNFNNWSLSESAFQLLKINDQKFSLTIDKNKLGQNGTLVKFKFVVNDKFWVQPNFEISNRVTDKEGNTNLCIQL